MTRLLSIDATPEFLYHGTSAAVARGVLAAQYAALVPRVGTGASNWTHAPSHRGAVYLTDAYPLYFALNAAAGTESPIAAVIELKVARLNPGALVPDEDVLEQAGRGRDALPRAWSMLQRTAHYRRTLKSYRGSDTWQASLRAMGTCAHFGAIARAAVTRIAFVDITKQAPLAMAALDASITVRNYQFCADKYRAITAHVMGDAPPHAVHDPLDTRGWLRQLPRDGIEVVTCE